MGRSVSSPYGASVTYAKTPTEEGYCWTCLNSASECKCPEGEADISNGEVDWGWVKDDLVSRAKTLFPSLSECDKWLGREDHALAENALVHFGVSEYCGLMAIWLVPRGDLEDAGKEAMAEHWIARVWPKFEAEFGEYRKGGTMSNGEGFYWRIGA